MKMFKDYAEYYDLFYLERKPYKRDCEMIYQWANRPDSMLDVCCGTANYWKYFPASVIYGVEQSQEMIEQSIFKEHIYHGDIMDCDFKNNRPVECVTALFNAINYLPKHDWWKDLPLKKDGYFIFDIWNTEKIKKDGFRTTMCDRGDIHRMIEPVVSSRNPKIVVMNITVKDGKRMIKESHPMYLYSHDDIKSFCGEHFEVDGIKETDVWHSWFRLKRK